MYHCFVCDQKFQSSGEFNNHPCFEIAIQNYKDNKTPSKELETHNEDMYKKWASTITPTEGIKHDSEKPDLSLIPYEALEEVARALMFGEKTYGRWNWKKGMKFSRLISATMRHIGQFNKGEDNASDTNLSHLAHAICNLMFMLYFIKNNNKEFDNRNK